MSMTVHFGWWLLPLALSIGAFVWAWWITPTPARSANFPVPDITGAFTFGAAIIASLVVWLAWALLA